MGKRYCINVFTCSDLRDIDNLLRPFAYQRVPGRKQYTAADRIYRPLVKKLYDLWSKTPDTERDNTVVIELTKKQLEKIEDVLKKHIRAINNAIGPKVDPNEQRAFSLKYAAILAKIKRLRI